jgi:hypothetical protein
MIQSGEAVSSKYASITYRLPSSTLPSPTFTILRLRQILVPYKGTREIRVILYAKDDSFCATAPADELSIEDVLAVEHDVIPLDGADVFQHGEIDSIGDRVALTQDPGDFARLPVDDARQDQVETTAGVSSAPTARGR